MKSCDCFIALAYTIVMSAGFAFESEGGTLYVTMSPDSTGDYVCDGTADDVEIKQALTHVANSSVYDTLYIKSGTYMIATGGMYVGSNTTVAGDSTAEVKIIDSADWARDNPVFQCERNTTDITICGFRINGNHTNNSTQALGSGYYDLLYFPHSNNVTPYTTCTCMMGVTTVSPSHTRTISYSIITGWTRSATMPSTR